MKSRILFGLSGSIACFKACALISKLVQNGFEVQTVATRSALQFVGPATLEGLTGRPVLGDTFEAGHHMDHIQLNRWADLIILCPASANTMAKMASGLGDDLWSTLFIAHDFSKPYLIAPAMNPTMLAHPSTQKSIQTLESFGVQVLKTEQGVLACGETGAGRLLDPEAIFQTISALLQKPSVHTHPLRVLVTAGGTREPIDGVRAIANGSTGQTGAFLADYFAHQGHAVTLVKAVSAVSPQMKIPTMEYVTYQDLDQTLQKALQENPFDLVIHAAAVSDYSVASVEVNGKAIPVSSDMKLSSSEPRMTLHLTRNSKIIDRLKLYSRNPELKVIGFKLTRNATEAEQASAALKVMSQATVDYVVQNDLSEITDDRHPSVIYKGDSIFRRCTTKQELAEALEHLTLQPLPLSFGPRPKEIL